MKGGLWLAAALAACGAPPAPPAPEPASAGEVRMPVPRAAHNAVALADGRVLLIGGCVRESCETGPESATVDAYDPATGRIERAGSLAGPRLSAAAILLPSGEVLIAGGWAGSAVSDSVELFDPASGRSRLVARLGQPRADIAAATLPDGRVLLAGGYDGSGPAGAVEIFDPKDQSMRRLGSLSVPRAGAAAALLRDGRLLIVGGGTGAGARTPAATAELFDSASGRSRPAGSLAEARYKHAAVALANGSVLVLGGSDARDREGKRSSVELFDPVTGQFRASGRLGAARYKIGSAVLRLANGRVLVAGGAPRSEVFDPATSRSRTVGPDFGASLNFATATLLGDGSVFVAGGYDENGIRMNGRAWRFRLDGSGGR